MLAMPGVEPRDEHDLRIWTPIAMWVAGSCTIGVGTVLPGGGRLHVAELRGLVVFGLICALFTFFAFRPLSNRALYAMTNVFTALGSLTIWFAVPVVGRREQRLSRAVLLSGAVRGVLLQAARRRSRSCC